MFVKTPDSSGAVNVLISVGENALMAVGDAAIYNYKPTNLRDIVQGQVFLPHVDTRGISNMAFMCFNTCIYKHGNADI